MPGDPYAEPPRPDSYLEAIKRKPKQLAHRDHAKEARRQPLTPRLHCGGEDTPPRPARNSVTSSKRPSPTLDQSSLMGAFTAFWGGGLAAGIDTIAKLTGQTPSREMFEGLTWACISTGKQVTASDYLQGKGLDQRRVARDGPLSPDLRCLDHADARSAAGKKRCVRFRQYRPDEILRAADRLCSVHGACRTSPASPRSTFRSTGTRTICRSARSSSAPFGDELTLLKLAAQLEKSNPWIDRYAKIKV